MSSLTSKIAIAAVCVAMAACGSSHSDQASGQGEGDSAALNEAGQQPVNALDVSRIDTESVDLLCIIPDLDKISLDLVVGNIPPSTDGSIALAMTGAFTGAIDGHGHENVAGDHVSAGVRHKGYVCPRNNGAFTWSPTSGPQFFYKDLSAALDKAAEEGGMGFCQEMLIHEGKAVKTTRPLDEYHQYRALCKTADDQFIVMECEMSVALGDFIDAMLSQNVKEALYTDMGTGWNYAFYRHHRDEAPTYLHRDSLEYTSNFVVMRFK